MWDAQFEELLRRHLPFISDAETIEPDAPLRDFGLDSLGTVQLLADLEAEYQVRFADDALSMESFRTPSVLWEALSSMLATAR